MTELWKEQVPRDKEAFQRMFRASMEGQKVHDEHSVPLASFAVLAANQAVLDAKLDHIIESREASMREAMECYRQDKIKDKAEAVRFWETMERMEGQLAEMLSRLPPALEQVKCGACQGAGILEGKEHSYFPDCGGSGIKDGFKDCKGTGKRP